MTNQGNLMLFLALLQKMPARLTIDKVRDAFSKAGCRLISTTYTNQQEPLDYICSCGSDKVHTITYKGLMAGQRCEDCRNQRKDSNTDKDKMTSGIKAYIDNKRLKYDDVRKYYEEQGCELLAYEYNNNLQEMWFVCNCGNLGCTSFKRFKDGMRCKKHSQPKQKTGIDFSSYSIEYTHMEKQTIKRNFV